MTCRQVRQLLAAYRRDDCSPAEHAEIEAHLLGCAECQAVDAEFRRVGESIKALPQIAPPPDFFARVMAAAQADGVKATQRTQVVEKKPETVVVPGMTNVSHFPKLRRAVAERRVRLEPMRQTSSPAKVFALRYSVALAATFLLFALGSVGLFQLLNQRGPIISSVTNPTQLLTSAFTSDSTYSVVADATASPDGQYIVYAAHTPQGSWMLEEVKQNPKGTSVALLPAPVAGPITIEGWARSWVLWTQGDSAGGEHWQLYATELSPSLPGATETLQLLKGGLSGRDGSVLALHGVHASGSTVLLAEQLKNEIGQLVQLDLTQAGPSARMVLATAPAGHWIADPTTDGTNDYWSEDWLDSNGTPHGNIMRLAPGSVVPVAITSNDASFAPMVIAGKMVWMEETPQQAQIDVTKPTPTATPNTQATLTPSGGGVSHAPIASGTLWSETLDPSIVDLDSGPRNHIADDVSTPQAGATFVVWQNSNGDFLLYDVMKGSDPQKLNSSISNALVLSVSPTAVLWVTADTPSNSQFPNQTTINLLDWPQQR